MGGTQRRTNASIADQLFAYPERYDFFQVVRLLEALNYEKSADHPDWQQQPVGHDTSPKKEIVQFNVDSNLQNPSGAVTQLLPPSFNSEKNRFMPAKMHITFMGLTGPSAVLPIHYTEMVLQQTRAKNYAMRDFFDIFNHRAISFHYRAFTKYRVEYSFEYMHRQNITETNVRTKLKSTHL